MENSISLAFSSEWIFSEGSDGDKMQVVYKKMTRDRAKSNVTKWNLIGEIQFKQVKNCLIFMKCNDWVCPDWTWTLFMVRNGIVVVWRERFA